jgi:hypothetical protein
MASVQSLTRERWDGTVARDRSQQEERLMRRRPRNRGGSIFAVALAIIVGLLWAGTIDAEMKWTATMFGLALAALVATRRD